MVSMSIAFATQRLSCVNGYMLPIFLLNCNQCPPPDSGSPGPPGPPGRTGPKGENGHKAIATSAAPSHSGLFKILPHHFH